jgi:hypothetical protein
MIFRIDEEVKSEYIEKMGEALGAQCYALWQEFIWLAMKWGEYEALYGGGSKRVDLLNEAAPAFFWMVEKVLWEDLLLHISRLTDRSETCGNSNLTLQNLPGLVVDPAIKSNLEELVITALNKTKFSRDWRNRRLAHYDLDLRINNGSARPLAPADTAQVREAMHAIREVLTGLDKHYLGTEALFVGSITRRGAFDLIPILYFGIKEQAKADERIRAGQGTEDDYPAMKLRD